MFSIFGARSVRPGKSFYVPELGRWYTTYASESCCFCCPIILFASPFYLLRAAFRGLRNQRRQ
jgi:hypothetical protein